MKKQNYPITILPDLRPIKAAEPTVEYFDIETGEFQKIRLSERKIKYGRAHPRAWTFGAVQTATPNPKVQITPESEKAALAVLEEANANKRLRLPISVKRQALRDAHVAWLNGQKDKCDLAVTLHLPYHLAHTKDALPTLMIEKHVDTFFRKVEKRVFSRTDLIRRRKNIKRVIVAEKADSVGFHLHMAMLLPLEMNFSKFIGILKELWIKFWAGQGRTFPREHAVWAEAINGEYVSYSLKDIGTDQAEVLWSSCRL